MFEGNFNGTAVPLGWVNLQDPNRTDQAFFNAVVRRYCRGCHISAQSATTANLLPTIPFESATDFQNLAALGTVWAVGNEGVIWRRWP